MYFAKYGMMAPGRTEPGKRLEDGQKLSAAAVEEPPEQQGPFWCCGRAGSLNLSELGLQFWTQSSSQMSDSGLSPSLQTGRVRSPYGKAQLRSDSVECCPSHSDTAPGQLASRADGVDHSA